MTDRAHRFFPSELLIRVYENVPRSQLRRHPHLEAVYGCTITEVEAPSKESGNSAGIVSEKSARTLAIVSERLTVCLADFMNDVNAAEGERRTYHSDRIPG